MVCPSCCEPVKPYVESVQERKGSILLVLVCPLCEHDWEYNTEQDEDAD